MKYEKGEVGYLKKILKKILKTRKVQRKFLANFGTYCTEFQ